MRLPTAVRQDCFSYPFMLTAPGTFLYLDVTCPLIDTPFPPDYVVISGISGFPTEPISSIGNQIARAVSSTFGELAVVQVGFKHPGYFGQIALVVSLLDLRRDGCIVVWRCRLISIRKTLVSTGDRSSLGGCVLFCSCSAPHDR